jgi:hypothetical protein
MHMPVTDKHIFSKPRSVFQRFSTMRSAGPYTLSTAQRLAGDMPLAGLVWRMIVNAGQTCVCLVSALAARQQCILHRLNRPGMAHIQVIRPSLHHAAALVQVFRPVIGRPDAVALDVGKLALYGVHAPALFREQA